MVSCQKSLHFLHSRLNKTTNLRVVLGKLLPAARLIPHKTIQNIESPPLQVLELFAGIGGLAAAFPSLEIDQAIDIDPSARDVYSLNFNHVYSVKEIASLPLEFFSRFCSDFWWMSPPCTPFTKRGARRDLDDHRSNALQHLIQVVATIRPPLVCIENVIGFESSQAFQYLYDQWIVAGYHIQTHELCPSTLGWPNRRPRVYCIASLDGKLEIQLPISEPRSLSPFIDQDITLESHPSLWLKSKTVEDYFHAMDRVSLANDSAITACFASSYGKTIVRSGSYLETPFGYRRFSPREVARLLGFNDHFRLPDTLTIQRQWHLLGNSLSLPAVRHLLKGLL